LVAEYAAAYPIWRSKPTEMAAFTVLYEVYKLQTKDLPLPEPSSRADYVVGNVTHAKAFKLKYPVLVEDVRFPVARFLAFAVPHTATAATNKNQMDAPWAYEMLDYLFELPKDPKAVRVFHQLQYPKGNGAVGLRQIAKKGKDGRLRNASIELLIRGLLEYDGIDPDAGEKHCAIADAFPWQMPYGANLEFCLFLMSVLEPELHRKVLLLNHTIKLYVSEFLGPEQSKQVYFFSHGSESIKRTKQQQQSGEFQCYGFNEIVLIASHPVSKIDITKLCSRNASWKTRSTILST
jgi:hypothetical protein